MSNEHPTPNTANESTENSNKVSPFLTSPLPEGTPQGQQETLNQTPQDTPITGQVPHYNLPRGAGKTGNVGDTTHFGFKTVRTEDKAQKVAEVFHSVASK